MESRLETIKFKKWELKKAVIESIVLGILSGGGSPLKPSLPIVVDGIVKLIKEKKKLDIAEKKIKRVLSNLEKQEIISLNEEKGMLVLTYKIDNDIRMRKYSLKLLFKYRNKKKVWDKKWRLIVFDVPEIQRNKRIYLKDFLKFLGFYLYQKSVYVFPYDCKKEVEFIKRVVIGGKYIKYLVVEEIEGEKALKKHFNLS